MQLSHALTKLEAAVDTQLRIAGPEVVEAGQHLMAALIPAISQTMIPSGTTICRIAMRVFFNVPFSWKGSDKTGIVTGFGPEIVAIGLVGLEASCQRPHGYVFKHTLVLAARVG